MGDNQAVEALTSLNIAVRCSKTDLTAKDRGTSDSDL